MATKSRHPNLGNARKASVASGKSQSQSLDATDSKRQITLSRFFKLPKKHVPSGSSYDGEKVNNTQTAGKKTPTRKRSGCQSSPESPRDVNGGAKKKAKTVAGSPELEGQTVKNERIRPSLSSSTLSTLSSFSAYPSSHNEEATKRELVKGDKGERHNERHKGLHDDTTSDSPVRPPHEDTEFTNTSRKQLTSSSPRTRFKFDKCKDSSEVHERKGSRKKYTALKERGKLTPLEKQVTALKEQNPDAILFIECGYRYRFFDKDAEIAAKELHIQAFPDHNFIVASIPTHRLFIHARRLVSKGYKVGVVKQTETAAIKASGSNKLAPFERKLTALYTKSTMIGEDLQSSEGTEASDAGGGSEPNTFLLCVCEIQGKKESKSKSSPEIGIVAIQPSTGDIIYDSFHDNSTRQELETRVHHIKPVEMLLPERLSPETEKLLRGIISMSTTDHDRIRTERFPQEVLDKTKAFEEVSSFFSESQSNNSLQEVLQLPIPVLCCLSALIRYLKEFRLDRIIQQTRDLKPFSHSTRRMKLNACAVQNLEIFCNQVDGKTKGSLLWVVDHTRTSFGKRELTRWISQPLSDTGEIKLRQDAIQELLETKFQPLNSLKEFLEKTPDLEKSLCSIYHKKCSPAEFVNIIESLDKCQSLCSAHAEYARHEIKSELLLNIFLEVPRLLADIEHYFAALNKSAAKEGDKTRLFTKPEDFPEVHSCMIEIERLTDLMSDHSRKVRLLLRMPALAYVTVSGYEYLIEVKHSSIDLIPEDWIRINSTRRVSRFRPPYVEETFKELCVAREKLVLTCQQAWLQYLDGFGEQFVLYRQAVKHLAKFDCLLSLSEVAKQNGFCRPEILDSSIATIHIENGRHPVVSSLLGEGGQYVPNSTHLEADKERFLCISGPNMGGKSSYLKQVALIVILAQLGSYVPAESASITPVDAVYIRMGASDNIFKHQSTFMVELMEASTILAEATPRSLVIMDELGRGTSTHDGVAIADASAKHLISEIKCLTLFVTHYPPLADLEGQYPGTVGNYHMSFLIDNNKGIKETDEEPGNLAALTFLYQLVKGAASHSYGLNVARMADLPREILELASQKSKELEDKVHSKRIRREDFLRLWMSEEKSEIRDVIGSCLEK